MSANKFNRLLTTNHKSFAEAYAWVEEHIIEALDDKKYKDDPFAKELKDEYKKWKEAHADDSKNQTDLKDNAISQLSKHFEKFIDTYKTLYNKYVSNKSSSKKQLSEMDDIISSII
jgi:DNA anti-recombination protein RmuC